MQCSSCRGAGRINTQQGPQRCGMCDGSGQEYDPGRYYIYEAGPIVLAGGAGLNSYSVQILNYSFRWRFAAAVSTGIFAAQVIDGSSQRPFSNQQVHSSNLWGTAESPTLLLSPFIFEKRGQILINLTELTGAPNTIRLAFIGEELND